MRVKESGHNAAIQVIAYTTIALFSIVCLFPFLLILSGSFTENNSIMLNGYHLVPEVFSFEGYSMVFSFPKDVLKAYGVTASCTLIGSALGLFFITMAGYVLQRKDFKYRNHFSFYIYFTTLFSGGLVPWYILLTKYFHLTDNYLAIILPQLMSPFLIILMKNFIRFSVPYELTESAKIDGANDFKIYTRVILPLALPGIATVGLFLALAYWNDWFLSSLFINDPSKYELQYYLYNTINTISFLANIANGSGVTLSTNIPTESTKMAMSIIVTGPIILLYPFIQKYFVKGLTVGAVKG